MQRDMDLERRSVLVGLGASILTVGSVSPAFAVSEEVRRKINLAGRQRMLSQRIAKAAFFFQLGIEPERHLEMLADAHGLFDKTLADLQNGNPDIPLAREESREVRADLGRVSSAWGAYSSAVKEVVSAGEVTTINLFSIVRANIPVLKASHAVVQRLEAVYGGAGARKSDLAATINIAGRQRMLTQKMTKEACQLSIYGRPREIREELQKTTTLFDTSLAALGGQPSELEVVSPPNDAIASKLTEVAQLWQEFGPLMKEVSEGRQPTKKDYAFLADKNDVLLKTMNQAVGLYQEVDA